jgi:TetR/AcrR family transcriptional regulator
MSEPGSRRGRVHDAEGAREAILNAAEEVFAQHGFDGARIDDIAKVSGYNKSLIFHYFDNKLGLYAEVVKRADRETSITQIQELRPFLEDESLSADPYRFRTLIETSIRVTFDYMVEHPHVLRIFQWEQAEGWQTYMKIASQLNTEDMSVAERLIAPARRAGLLRSNVDPVILFIMAAQLCMTYLSSIPLYQGVLPDRDFSSSAALASAREQIVEFVVHGIMADSLVDKAIDNGSGQVTYKG